MKEPIETFGVLSAVRRRRMMHPGQTVQIEEHGEVFILLRIDRQRHLADLLRPGSVNKVETGIPVAALRIFREPIPEEATEN